MVSKLRIIWKQTVVERDQGTHATTASSSTAHTIGSGEWFESHRQQLEGRGHLDWWGYTDSRQEYERWLSQADVAVSTAAHEFFGGAYACTVFVPYMIYLTGARDRFLR